ncbi:MAG: secondary thiamine-phosphate synthase enzyme YjbQ [Candidatus Latescibacterota bacterium]|nr:secondary thiamine-phosphate synthase enzyme YjbQ [Candidatus Latescibacterota bacterium]
MPQKKFSLPAVPRGIHLVTSQVEKFLPKLPDRGLLHLFIQHTSAGLTLNENADPTVRSDMAISLDELVRENASYYQHTIEGADDMPAHIKVTLVGNSVSIPITNGKLNLGTWQGIYLCEFRNNGGERNLIATIIGTL